MNESMTLTTIVGLIAATLTTISFLPQAIKIIRTKDTSGLSVQMYIVFTTGVFFWLSYGVLINDLPVIIANAITLMFSAIILSHLIKYRK